MQVEVGQIVNTHGIKGEVKVKSNSDFTDTRFQPGEVLIVNHHHNEIEMTITSYRIHKGFHMLKFEGINNINDVEQYKGDYLFQTNFTILILLGVRFLIMIHQLEESLIFLKQVPMMYGLLKVTKNTLFHI